jgi:hypothetical protein
MAGLRWASCGLTAGPDEMGRAFGLGSNRKDKICFFFKIFFSAKTNSENARKCLEARKIPRKSQKFQENSQR